ncbi:hypothetical protein [Gluconobacter roseus]|uniref:DUF4230 domain-containing protein n=1 Tax=Gluconobacter roseus NBRC 3990 TaxID=1307950 RepID=A0A4Y3M1T6_9PROT|nr:hypothetical protein [Gluconobacter roseus]KXV44016.1 hypothetical protein AD943_06260 [Gluconobacter roseus]GBR48481.1 hypothetical protein AA3990_2144 [Gluconobacter roseus NBRC 3990]GEB03260.1 hypothetical protein GRO01_08360 [Gluconobacter roseus NBRC 3990]GLP93718.1 hypothetical protein GCM10007871_16960 [Gluconobacter roseus NBRC 3990]
MSVTSRLACLGPSVLALSLLSACSAGSPSPVTISEAISGIQTDLTKTGVVSTSHIQDWTPEQISLFDTNVRTLQCIQHVPDPVVAMISGPVTLSLSGSFTSSGSFSVSSSGAIPVFGLQADASRMKGQTLGLPVQFVPLSALPDAEMAREVGYAGDLLAQSDTVRQTEGARIAANRDALSQHVRTLIGTFSEPCSKETVHPFVGVPRQP